MPPKEKVSKACVTRTAFEMTREYGFSAVTARKLAERLGCSTQPIFRAYENMDEIRTELFYMSMNLFIEEMLKTKGKSPAYLGLALKYIELARQEKNLFELIASIDDFGTKTIDEFVKGEEGEAIYKKIIGNNDATDKKKKELFMMFWMFVHGMASLIVSNRVQLSEREIKGLITKAYEGFVGQL